LEPPAPGEPQRSVLQNKTKREGVRLETDLRRSGFDAAMARRAFNNFKNAVLGQTVGNYTKSYETWRRVSNVVNSFKEELSTEKTPEWQVLDLGCGDGYHLMLLSSLKETRETKVHFHGIDISPTNVMLAKQVAQDLGIDNITFEIGNIENMGSLHNEFDIIINTDVIEHLVAPEEFVGSVFRALKPGGLTIITTPNSNNSLVKIASRITSKKRTKFISYSVTEDEFAQEKLDNETGHGHISIKGLSEWMKIFRESGFAVEHIKRGSMLFGGPKYNNHPFFFAFFIIVDKIFDWLFFTKTFSEAHTYKLRKTDGK